MAEDQAKKRLAKQREQYAKQATEDMQNLMKLPAFRRYVSRWIQACGIAASGNCASEELHYRAGARDVGLGMEKELKAVCFDAWLQMQSETKA